MRKLEEEYRKSGLNMIITRTEYVKLGGAKEIQTAN